MLDIQELLRRVADAASPANWLAADDPGEDAANVASPASRLANTISQLATLATVATHEPDADASQLATLATDDDRVQCTGCKFYRARLHRCARHRAAGLSTHEVGPDLASLPQRCPAHAPRP